MSDTPAAERPPATDAAEPYPEPDPTEPPPTPGTPSLLSRWPTLAALAIALIALALAIVGWFSPPHDGEPPAFTGQQTQDAKTKMCAAYMAVNQEVAINTRLPNPVPDNPIGALAVRTNARLALYGGGGYLKDRLAMEPATPADLAKAVTAMANTLQDLAIGYLRGAPDFTQEPLRRDLLSEIAQINELCK